MTREIDMTTRHGSVYRVAGFAAACICGWQGSTRDTRDEAFAEMENHYDTHRLEACDNCGREVPVLSLTDGCCEQCVEGAS